MKKIIIIYGSTTGNTEQLAHFIGNVLEEHDDLDVTTKNVMDAGIEELPEYDVILLGSSTWGDGDLQDDFVDFYEQMKVLDLTAKTAAAFGTGDSSWEHFCGAVDMLEERLIKCGADVIKGFKVDGEVEDAKDEATHWVNDIIR